MWEAYDNKSVFVRLNNIILSRYQIIEVSDAIMVARGDLGIEVEDILVPSYQNLLINKCLSKGKSVIVATQMLESMQKNCRPTKAEISDVYNAVQEGTSATMLSGESASGQYPVESIKYMYNINKQSEKTVNYYHLSCIYKPQNIRENFLCNVVQMALNLSIKGIIVENSEDAYNISKFHSSVMIFVFVKSLAEATMFSLNFGIIPILTKDELLSKISFIFKNNIKNRFIFIQKDKIEIKNL
ncbi:hypothetical protein DH96_01425 [Candidatus Phytoplasma oryzae]|uniref:Pyruvate kinase n=1 Tax=Candidatus Phytoplasma oryzae TaxID=203274 RepID=A0A328IR83_9MOLU|nr:hypothetical protein DH96_01425 [Candidatus Phytoplasma oryzae]